MTYFCHNRKGTVSVWSDQKWAFLTQLPLMSHPHNCSLCYVHLTLHRSSEGSQKRNCIWRPIGRESLGKELTQISELLPLLSTHRTDSARAWSLGTSWHSWHLGTYLLLFVSWANLIQKSQRGNKYQASQILFLQNNMQHPKALMLHIGIASACQLQSGTTL